MIAARNLFWLLPVLALTSFPLWKPPVKAFLTPRSGTGEVGITRSNGGAFRMDKVIFSQSKKGTRDWQIKADRLYTVGNEDYIRMERVAALFSGAGNTDQGGKPMYISGGEGAYYNNLKVLTLADDVVVHTSDGYEMQTENLTYLEGLRQFKTSNGIKILGHNIDLRGRGLFYDLASGDYVVDGRVYVTTW